MRAVFSWVLAVAFCNKLPGFQSSLFPGMLQYMPAWPSLLAWIVLDAVSGEAGGVRFVCANGELTLLDTPPRAAKLESDLLVVRTSLSVRSTAACGELLLLTIDET